MSASLEVFSLPLSWVLYVAYAVSVFKIKPFRTRAWWVILPFAFLGFELFVIPLAPRPGIPSLFMVVWMTLPFLIALAVHKVAGETTLARRAFVIGMYVNAILLIPVVEVIFYS